MGRYAKFRDYGLAVVAVAAAFALRQGLDLLSEGIPRYVTFSPAVMLAALLGGWGPGLAATALSALLATWWILPFEHEPPGLHLQDAVSLALFSGTGVFMSIVAESYRRARQRATAAVAELALQEKLARAADALRASRQMLRAVLDTVPVRVFWKDCNGVYLGCNQPFVRDAGLDSPEQVIGQDDFSLVGREHAGKYRADDQHVIQTGEAMLAFEDLRTAPDGRRLWLRVNKVPLRDENGSVVGVLGTYEDITESRRIEKALRESEAKYRAVFESAGDAIFLLRVDRGELWVVECNQRALEMFRATAQEIRQFPASHFWADLQADGSPSTAAAAARIAQVREAAEAAFEWRYRRHDGTVFEAEVTLTRVALGGGEHLLALVRDVTQRKRAENNLRESERKNRDMSQEFRSILEAIPGSLALISRDFRVVWCNEYTATSMYVTHAQMLSQPCYRSRHNRSEPCEVCPVRQCFASGKIEYGERDTPDGRIWELRAAPVRGESGEVKGVIEIANDVTEFRRASRELEASESTLRGIFLATPIGIAFIRNRVLVSANEWTYQVTGYGQDELVGQNARMLYLSQEEYEAAGRQLYAAPAPPKKHTTVETRFRRKDGAIIDVRLTSSLLRPEDPAAGYVSTVQDITEHKRWERDLASAKCSAEQSRTIAESASRAKDEFIAVLSHELRTPLTPVLATVSMMLKDRKLRDDARENLEVVLRNIELEARLIDDLLDVTRIARGKLELRRRPVELAQVIHRAVEVCRPDIEGRWLEFALDLGDGGSCVVEADAARLQQVFWNLLKNAIKFTPQGGRVGIRCCRADEHVTTQVTDTGVGIEPEQLPRLFGAFQQAERATRHQFGGLGLGLAISRGLVEMHGGTITAESRGRGQGATFTVTLPTRAVPAPDATGRPPQPLPRAAEEAGGLRILLVEDHADTARIIAWILKAAGHDVKTAGAVATALQEAETHEFDLLVSDLGLPDGSGVELLRELRARGRTFPAVAVTGYGQEEDIRRTREVGFGLHLTKPIDADQLYHAVSQFRVA